MSNTLKHHGILGMKWGVRRFQNKDGSLTSAGKKRTEERNKVSSLSDEELSTRVKRMNLEKMHNQLTKQNTKASNLEKTKKVVDATSNIVNQAKNLNRESINNSSNKEKLDLSKMTDQQLRDRINRTNLERQYNEIFSSPATLSKGQQYVSTILDVGGTTLAFGSSALAIALAIKELRK